MKDLSKGRKCMTGSYDTISLERYKHALRCELPGVSGEMGTERKGASFSQLGGEIIKKCPLSLCKIRKRVVMRHIFLIIVSL